MNNFIEQDTVVITDGGIETTLIYQHGIELREFSSFELLMSDDGKRQLRAYFTPYFELAESHGKPLILETPTWRSNADWGNKLGYTEAQLNAINQKSVRFLRALRDNLFPTVRLCVSGCVGPRGDGYIVNEEMSCDEAYQYHFAQVRSFAESQADVVTGITMTNIPEAMGLARACKAMNIPCVISFTVETDGRLPSGHTVEQAIVQIDADSAGSVDYFMINCAHPSHFANIFSDEKVQKRVRGIRANASRCSHEELNQATELDAGNCDELALEYRSLRAINPNIKVLGGCCGTDHTHIKAITNACCA